jgi:hypothetical protein
MRIWLGVMMLAIGLAGGAPAVPAQTPSAAVTPAPRYPTGLAPIAAADYDKLPKLGQFRAWLPRHVDLSPLFPLPGNQAPKPDCTAWATAYSSLGYLHGLAMGHRPQDAAQEPSPVYVYNRLRPRGSACNVATRIVDALTLLKTEGTLSLADFPDNPDVCATPEEHSLVGAGFRQKLGGWQAIERENPRDHDSPVVIDDIKGALFRQQPVVFAMPAPDDFMVFSGTGNYTHATAETSNWHAMALVGYDEDRQAFRVINSWGDRWGDHGYVWIAYETFRRLAGEAYALQSTAEVRTAPDAANLTPRQALDAQIANLPCGSVRLDDAGAHPVLTGFAGSEAALDALHQAMLAFDPRAKWAMDYHPWPQCEAELTLALPIGTGGVRLTAQNAEGAAREGDPVVMAAGEKFGFSAETTAARPWLTVIYLQADGSAVTLYQGQPAPDWRGHRQVGIGTGGSGQVQFQVGAPFGAEMIIAIASAQPLFGAELENYATERQFLSGLRARLTQAAPGTIAAAVLRIRTRS